MIMNLFLLSPLRPAQVSLSPLNNLDHLLLHRLAQPLSPLVINSRLLAPPAHPAPPPFIPMILNLQLVLLQSLPSRQVLIFHYQLRQTQLSLVANHPVIKLKPRVLPLGLLHLARKLELLLLPLLHLSRHKKLLAKTLLPHFTTIVLLLKK